MSDSKKKLIILTAGGTGGHVYPADALAQELEKRNYNLMLVTDQRGLNNYHGKLGEIENKAVLSGALVGKNIWFKIKSLIKVSLGILQSVYIIIKYKPECVVGFGGYASFPCAVAAILTGTDLIIHEQNSVMSRTNRFLAKYASKIATSFPKTKYAPQGNQTVLTGMPVRTTISALFDKQYKQPEQNGKFNLLVLGGSQGAKIFSEVIPQAIKSLDEKIQQNIHITQQCRKDDIELLQKEYSDAKCSAEISNFFKNMPELYDTNHIIISRAGASSVCEIAAAGIPSILVPLPTAADDHQTFNASEFKNKNGGMVIAQKDFTAEKLQEILEKFINNPTELEIMARNTKKFAIIDADKRLADVVETIIKRD